MAVPKNGGRLTTAMLFSCRTIVLLLVANYECVGAIFMWTAPLAFNQTVAGTDGARTVVIPVRNGTTDYPLRWNYTLAGQTITLTFFAVGDGISQPNDIGFVVNPGRVGESTTINNVNDFQTRFRLQSDSQSSTLTIIKVNEREDATFQCRVQVGSDQWIFNVRVEVTDPPIIINTSGNQTVTEGDNVTLSCTAIGSPTPNITWTRLSDNTVVANSIWTLININRLENGTYRCTADNSDIASPATEDVFITVQFKPENVTLNASISSNKACAGDVVKFTCKAGAANPEEVSYTLYQNGAEIANMSSSGIFTLSLTTSGQVIYRCEASNSAGTGTSNNVSVIVDVPSKVVYVNDSIDVTEGKNAALFCDAFGVPSPSVSWVDAKNNVSRVGPTLVLTNLTEDNQGDSYTCIASNACGNDNKSTAVNVYYIRSNLSEDLSITANNGDPVVLTCFVDGNPKPSITWSKDGGVVKNSLLRIDGRALSFNAITKDDSGCYTCSAVNEAGKVDATLCVTVEEPPPETEGVTRRITLTITNKNCQDQRLVERFRAAVTKVLNYLGLEYVDINIRCGSVIVDLVLRFNQSVSENEVISTLKTAAEKDKFGEFKVDPNSIKVTPDDTEVCEESFFKDAGCSMIAWRVALIAIAGVALIALIAAAVAYWIHNKRKCRKDTRIAHDPECEEQRLQGDDPYAQANNGYADTGPRSANSTDKAAAAAIPDYAVVDKSAKKKKKKQDEEKPPEYAVVDKSLKKKKDEKLDCTYAEVDKSKKTSKKKPKPGEDVVYADLGDLDRPQMTPVATSPKALPPIKKPDPYEGTQYADITEFLKGDATLPKVENNQGTEMKPQDEQKDEAGTENKPKETPM